MSVLTEWHDVCGAALGGAADASTSEIQTQHNLGRPGPSQYHFPPQPWWGAWTSPQLNTYTLMLDICISYLLLYDVCVSLPFAETLLEFPCKWNYRPDHCIYGSNCASAEEDGVYVLHGNRGVYHDHKQPAFRAVYEAIRKVSTPAVFV